MDNTPFTSYEIQERSFVSFIKREIHHQAGQAGFSEQKVGAIDIIVSELTSNLIKHAGSGELLYRFTGAHETAAIELVSLDNGPGIKDVANSMKDGVSTTKTLGQGLGAIERMSDLFQLYSMPGWGTIGYTRVLAAPQPVVRTQGDISFTALIVCKPGEQVSGDGCSLVASGKESRMFVGDGLGHGPEAHNAVKAAIDAFRRARENDPAEILRSVHLNVKKTRGLVGTVVIGDHAEKKWKICGIGNIATRLYEGLYSKNYISYNGIIGMNIPTTLNNHILAMGRHQCIVMTSDGIRTRWDLAQFPSILRYEPIVMAAAIYKECARKNDDMSVIIGRT